MADEVTGGNNVEQLVLCFRWADADLYVLEDFVRIHAIENIESDTVVVVAKDVITRFNIPSIPHLIVVGNVKLRQAT